MHWIRLLRPFQSIYGYADVMLLDPEGNIVYSSDEEHQTADLNYHLQDGAGKSFEEGKKGVYLSDIFKNPVEHGNLGMYVTAPVYGFDGKFSGVIAFELDMAPFFKLLQDTAGLGETGETLIGQIPQGEEGRAVFLTPLRDDPEAALKREVIFKDENPTPIQRATQKRENNAGIAFDYRGRQVLAAWRYIPDLDWGLVIKIDIAEAFAPVNKLRNTLISVSLAVLLFSLFAAILLSQSISKPIVELTKAADDIAEGNLETRIRRSDRSGEIGILSNALYKMTGNLTKALEQTKAANKMLIEIDKTKTEFVSLASHQLRTPLTSIKWIMQQAIGGDEPVEWYKEYLKDALDSTERMIGLVNDLLNVSRLEAGVLKAEPEKFMIGDFLSEIVKENQAAATGKHQTIVLEGLNPEIEVFLDKQLTAQVIGNLISNALGYSAPDTTVTVAVKRNKDTVEISVKDQGIGISEQDQKKLFTKFFRTAEAAKLSTKGSGLGLYVVEKIIKICHGSIKVDSETGKGSAFTVILPMK